VGARAAGPSSRRAVWPDAVVASFDVRARASRAARGNGSGRRRRARVAAAARPRDLDRVVGARALAAELPALDAGSAGGAGGCRRAVTRSVPWPRAALRRLSAACAAPAHVRRPPAGACRGCRSWPAPLGGTRC
jgi:hypothetical protein